MSLPSEARAARRALRETTLLTELQSVLREDNGLLSSRKELGCMEQLGGDVAEGWSVKIEAETWDKRILQAKEVVCQVTQESSVPSQHPMWVRYLYPSHFTHQSKAEWGLHFLLSAPAPWFSQPLLVCSVFSSFSECFGAEIISQVLVAVGGSRHRS